MTMLAISSKCHHPSKTWIARNATSSSEDSVLSIIWHSAARHAEADADKPGVVNQLAKGLALASASGQGFVADCATQTRLSSDQPENKNAGGYPPALGESPNWETQLDYTIASCELLETLLPELLEEVLLEVAESTEERHIGPSLQMPLELQTCQLDPANVICNLSEPIAFSSGVLVHDRLSREARCNGRMDSLCHNTLPTVVVNLDGIESLQIGQVVEKEYLQVTLDSRSKCIETEGLSFVINERPVLNWQMLNKHSERMQVLFAHLNSLPLVFIIAINQRIEMKRCSIKTALLDGSFVQFYIIGNLKLLLMEHEAYEIEIGNNPNVSRFVNENRQLLHSTLPSAADRDIKNAGGNPPALGGPPIRRIQILYTTNRNVYSIVPKVEHMFYTIDTNICSPYRKAA